MPFAIIAWSALAIACYRHVIGDLIDQWQTNASYSHGPIVIPIALWLLWCRRATLPAISQPWIAGVGLLLVAHVLLWVGEYFYLPGIQRWTLPLWLCGMIGLLGGRSVLVWSLPGVGFLAFMIPLPFLLQGLANHALQWASAWCSCFLLALTSTFATTDGYTLRMGSGQVGITADCSGLRMTVAIAALSYVITVLSHDRRSVDRSGGEESRGQTSWRSGSRGLARQLGAMMWLVIPAAIAANAARIMVVALVLDRYQRESYTAWAHDLGDWCVLPISAALFLLFRAWLVGAVNRWNTETCRPGFSRVLPRRSCRPLESTLPRLAIAMAPVAVMPVALALIAGASVWHHHSWRERIITQMMATARNHEASADWDNAAACYRKLTHLQSSPTEASYRHAFVTSQVAKNQDDRKQALFQLEAVLAKEPFHVEALKTHLDMALDLAMAAAAARSAGRLYWIDHRDLAIRQMCLETTMRFPLEPSTLPELSSASFCKRIERCGPAATWRDPFVIAVASFCCDHPGSIDPRFIGTVDVAIMQAANRLKSPEAHFQNWRLQTLLRNKTESLEIARMRIDDRCPDHVAHRIYLASAEEAWIANQPHDAKRYLKNAIDRVPRDHRAYHLLGDVCESQQEWGLSTAAYLRAWRLAGDRPLALGIKLAECLIRTNRHAASIPLVQGLARDVQDAAITPSRDLRIRLQLAQSRLDMHSAKYDQALHKLRRCQLLATLDQRQSPNGDSWLPTIESMQARCLVRTARYADAARLFENQAGRSDSPTDQWMAAARAWRTVGNGSAAARCYRTAMMKDADRSDVWLEYVQCLKETQAMEVAFSEVALRSSGAHRDPSIEDRVLAQAWEVVGRSDRAIPYYRSAARSDVREVAALAIAMAVAGQGDRATNLMADDRWTISAAVRSHTAAIVGVSAPKLSAESKETITRVVTQGVSAAGDDAAMLFAAAQWYTKRQDNSAAMKLLSRVVRLQPSNVVAANNLAMLMADERIDFERAIEYIDNVLKQTGPVSEFLDTKGWILVQMDRAEEALPWLTRAAAQRSASTDPIAQLHLATAYMDLGESDHAREHLKLATAGQIHRESLNASEQRAWTRLQRTLVKPGLSGKGGDT